MQWKVSLFERASKRVLYCSAAACFALILSFLVFSHKLYYQIPPSHETVQDESHEAVHTEGDTTLSEIKLSPEGIRYAKLEFVVKQSQHVNAYPRILDVSVPDFEFRSSQEILQNSQENTSKSVIMHVPIIPSSRPDASHILFGLATTLERLEESLQTVALWAAGTETRILAVVNPHSRVYEVKQKANDIGVHLTIIESDDDFLDSYFSLVRFLFQNLEDHTQWVGFIDDDTFFPSMANLVSRLFSYNSQEPLYLGTLSEDLAQMYGWGYMGYGGGGIFLSIPLLYRLNDVYEDCKAIHDTGDRRISRCIYHHTTTKLTIVPGLCQLDLHGDMSGFYESGRPLPLSLHHWKSWYPVDMVALSAVRDICGDECLLRRWRLSDDWFLVNGFSLVKYSTPPPVDDDLSMESTWDESEYMRAGEGFEHSLAPLRPKDEGKISFRLQGCIRDGLSIRQFYIRSSTSGDPDQVVEVSWRLE